MESKLAPRLPVGRNVLQRSGRRDRAAEVVVGEIPASEKGKDNVTAWKEISARGNDGNNECSRYSKVGQPGKLPGDRARQTVVTHAPVQAKVNLTGGNRSGLTGSNRSGPVPVSAGTQPAKIQILNLNSKNEKISKIFLKILQGVMNLMVSNFLKNSFI